MSPPSLSPRRSDSRRRPTTLLLLLLHVLRFAEGNQGNGGNVISQGFLRQPVDQTAIQGEHVTLPCQVENKRGMLQWTRDGFGLGIERNLTGFDRYHMVGSDEEGDFTLDINPVTLEDDATFQCQVGAASGALPIRSENAVLTVTVPPEGPVIINGAALRTTEDTRIEVECVSRGGKPAAEMTWLDGEGAVLSEGIEKSTREVENTRRVTAVSKIKFTASKEHHNTSLTCQAQNSADREPRSARILLLVEYAPHVSVKAGHEPLAEGEDVIFNCEAHGNPKQMSFRWFLSDAIVPGNHGTLLRIDGLDRSQNGAIVKCEVSNAIGKSEETQTLDINYPPVFTTRPTDVSGDPGQEVTLSCAVDGNPAPGYTWFRNGDLNTVRGYDNTLSVRISESTVGLYLCRASVKGFKEVSASASVLMRGPPRILRSQRVQYGAEGETVRLTCDAFAIPKPESLLWSAHGYPITVSGASGGHYGVEERGRADGMSSTLVIRDVIASDFGEYNCSVRNSHGEDAFTVTLERKKSVPLLIIIPAVIGGAILTVFAILVVVMCRRSHKMMDSSAATPAKSTFSTSGSEKAASSYSTAGMSTAATSSSSKVAKKMRFRVMTPTASDAASTISENAGAKASLLGLTTSALTASEAEWEEDSLDGRNHIGRSNGGVGGSGGRNGRARVANAGFGDYTSDGEQFNGGFAMPPHHSQHHHQYRGGFLSTNVNGGGGGCDYLQQQQQPPRPPPPPMHPDGQNGHAVDSSSPLNVGDPRYSARYGNPYLRTLAATSAVAADNTTTFASMNSHGGGGSRGYSTLNPAARHKNYAGTTAGNASLGRNGANGGGRSNYIMSAQSEEAKNSAALATHV